MQSTYIFCILFVVVGLIFIYIGSQSVSDYFFYRNIVDRGAKSIKDKIRFCVINLLVGCFCDSKRCDLGSFGSHYKKISNIGIAVVLLSVLIICLIK
jgi:hypothetical protein